MRDGRTDKRKSNDIEEAIAQRKRETLGTLGLILCRSEHSARSREILIVIAGGS